MQHCIDSSNIDPRSFQLSEILGQIKAQTSVLSVKNRVKIMAEAGLMAQLLVQRESAPNKAFFLWLAYNKKL